MGTDLEQTKGGFKRWRPKKWKPIYDQIVLLSVAGRSNKEIAEIVGVTPVHVGNVLRSPQASLIRGDILRKMQDKAIESVPEIIVKTTPMAAKRIRALIESDELFEKAPFAVADRAFKLLQTTGHLNSEASKAPVHEKTFIVSEEVAARLMEGMRRADDARKELPPAQDVDFEVLKTGTDD